jgi:predicted ATP-dependent endonuclease of OLD family
MRITEMAHKITKFELKKLHGYQNISIPIKDNKIVLIGVNGIGKTTVVNLLYFFLTRQWKKILEYTFSQIGVTLNGKQLSINRQDLEIAFARRHGKRGYRRYPFNVINRRIQSHPLFRRLIQGEVASEQVLFHLASDVGIPPDEIYRFISSVHNVQISLFEDMEDKEYKKALETLRKIEKHLEQEIGGPILYLPTYRRIEQDLEKIFPGLEEEIEEYRQRPSWREEGEQGYIEFVEFGMQDVAAMLKDLLNDLRADAITQLNNLAGGYLRDVLRDEAESYDASVINKLEDESIRKILDRVETLNDSDKRKLMGTLNKIKSAEKRIVLKDKMIAHFFSKLYQIYIKQKRKEQPVRSFVDVSNKYLSPKKIIYDEINYQIVIKDKNIPKIELRMLSSGEKQIVSLFSHLYLSNYDSCSVIIDEPELSLSVEWQKTFLPDVIASNKCAFLGAVTHSPFIYANELEPYTVDLQDFIK